MSVFKRLTKEDMEKMTKQQISQKYRNLGMTTSMIAFVVGVLIGVFAGRIK